MLHIFDGLRDITFFTVAVRMLLTVVLGGMIGMERSYKNRPAGFRTHILVAIGAAIASMTGIYLYINLHFPTDLSRLGAQVVSGLGFIGGGTIIVTKRKTIKGLTTAAGLWCSGIIGLAVGAGFYEGGIITALLVLLVEIFLSDIGSRIRQNPECHIQVIYTDKAALDKFLRYCKDNRFSIHNLQVNRDRESDTPLYNALVSLRSRKFSTADDLLKYAASLKGVCEAEKMEL